MDILYTLMDQTLIDSNGERCGRVDDIVVEDVFDRPARVVALLSGGGAKSQLLGSFVHRASLWWLRVLGLPGPIAPVQIPWEQVDRVEDDVRLKLPAEALGLNAVNRAVAQRFIGRIPGAHR
jgi:sporulation protein YlmC with PRC-barrel domain